MDQRSIGQFLPLKGLDATRIHHKQETVLGPDTIPYSTVTRTLHFAIQSQTDREAPHSEIDDATVKALGEFPFASLKELGRRLCYAPPTVDCPLIESLHFASKHLQWLPHELTSAQKVLRVARSNELLRLINSVRHNGPTFLETLDERWFYFRQVFERQWLPRDKHLLIASEA
jgi:hypothetical protein